MGPWDWVIAISAVPTVDGDRRQRRTAYQGCAISRVDLFGDSWRASLLAELGGDCHRNWPSWVVTATATWLWISDVALNPIWYRLWGLIDYQACR